MGFCVYFMDLFKFTLSVSLAFQVGHSIIVYLVILTEASW